MNQETTVFGRVLELSIIIQDAFSLKDKRQVIQSLVSKLRQKFNVSVLEAGFQEQWQRSRLAIAFISTKLSLLDQIQQEVIKFIESRYPIEITDINVSDF